LVKVASDGTASRAGDPKVGAASVKDDLELLGWRAQGDSAEVCFWSDFCHANTSPGKFTLCIQEVLDWDLVRATASIDGCVAEDILGRTSH